MVWLFLACPQQEPASFPRSGDSQESTPDDSGTADSTTDSSPRDSNVPSDSAESAAATADCVVMGEYSFSGTTAALEELVYDSLGNLIDHKMDLGADGFINEHHWWTYAKNQLVTYDIDSTGDDVSDRTEGYLWEADLLVTTLIDADGAKGPAAEVHERWDHSYTPKLGLSITEITDGKGGWIADWVYEWSRKGALHSREGTYQEAGGHNMAFELIVFDGAQTGDQVYLAEDSDGDGQEETRETSEWSAGLLVLRERQRWNAGVWEITLVSLSYEDRRLVLEEFDVDGDGDVDAERRWEWDCP